MKLITAQKASEEFGVPIASIRLACRKGFIAGAIKLNGKTSPWRFRREAFLAWLASLEKSPE